MSFSQEDIMELGLSSPDIEDAEERARSDEIWFKSKDKLILDACCGGRMFWFDKNHPDTLYVDIREKPRGFCPERPNFNISPDLVADFRDLPFGDNKFKLIIWDPPHIIRSGGQEKITGIIRKKYGCLDKDTWKEDLRKGFDELWRVLDVNGTLIFKWAETDVPVRLVLDLFSQEPLLGHPTAKAGKTIWLVFFKTK